MRVSDMARHFDRDPAYDGYTDALLFKCQYGSFNASSSDGATNVRRALSVAPSVTPPARNCIRLQNQRWLMGAPIDDSFEATPMRQNFNLKRVTDLVTILTPGAACLAGSGTSAYVHKHYFKDIVNAMSDTEYDTFWNSFFSVSEPVTKGAFYRDAGGVLFRLRGVYQVTEGYLVGQTDQLDAGSRQAVVFKTGAYDRVTDSFAATTVTTSALQFEPSKFYRFRVQEESQLKPGDKVVFVAASAVTPTTGMTFTMQSLTWQVVTVQAEFDAYAMLVRRV